MGSATRADISNNVPAEADLALRKSAASVHGITDAVQSEVTNRKRSEQAHHTETNDVQRNMRQHLMK